MNETYMKERQVFPLIVSMALPMVISMLVNSLYNIVDSFFVARINEDALTALSVIYPVQNLINAVSIGFGVGINARISYHLGAGSKEQACRAASRGVLLSCIHGIILTLICTVMIRRFMTMFTSDASVIELGVRYCRIAFAFSAVISAGLAFEKILQAAGRMKTTMLCMLSGCITNLILDPVLIFGIGPFPAMGIQGAAAATGAGQVLTLAVYLLVYRKISLPVCLSPAYLRGNWRSAGKLYSVGIPAALNLALPSLMISALNTILSAWSQNYIMILGIYYKLQTFLYLPASGIVQGMRPVIGYNYGARETERVSRIYQVTLAMCCVIMAAGTVICLAVPGFLMSLFTDHPSAISAGSRALRIISAGFLVSSVSVTASGALEGIGKGLPSLVISLCRYLIIILPAAFLLSRILGPEGVWHAFWAAELLTAAVSVLVYRKASVLS